jgi:Ca2+-binding RTX toxin-like protein
MYATPTLRRFTIMVLVLGAVGTSFPLASASGKDVPTCFGYAATIMDAGVIAGTADRDVIVGSLGPDVIEARGGNDVICGLAGGDIIHGGLGNDMVDAGEGDRRAQFAVVPTEPVN